MSLGLTISRLRHEISLAEAEARIAEWAARGLVMYSDMHTQSTMTRRLTPSVTERGPERVEAW